MYIMTGSKTQVIDKLPESANMEEMMYRLYVIDMISKGEQAIWLYKMAKRIFQKQIGTRNKSRSSQVKKTFK